jgi:hypothetical protein
LAASAKSLASKAKSVRAENSLKSIDKPLSRWHARLLCDDHRRLMQKRSDWVVWRTLAFSYMA